MDLKAGNSLWYITKLYPEIPEECRILKINDDGTFNMKVGSDEFESCTIKEPFVLYDSYERAELALVHSIYEALREGSDDLKRNFIHVCANDNIDELLYKYEENYKLIKDIFNRVHDNVIQCYMTAFSCGDSLKVFIDDIDRSNGLNRLLVSHSFRSVIVINDYVIDPDITFFPLSLKKYKWMLSRLNQDKEVNEIESLHRVVSWEKEIK